MKKFILAGGSALVLSLSFIGVASAAILPPPPAPLPTTVDQCKHGGWETYGDTFKNQGDCVSYVVTDGRNEPDGPAKN